MDTSETPFLEAVHAARTKVPRVHTGPLVGPKRAAIARREAQAKEAAPVKKDAKKGLAVEPVKTKKPRRFSNSVRAHRECKIAMCETTLNVPRAPFARIIRELTDDVPTENSDIRWTESAKFALHQAAEAYMIEYFSKVNVLASHAGRVGPKAIDFRTMTALDACTGGNVVMNGTAIGKLEKQLKRELYARPV
jgi:histone H3/H4